MGLTLGCELAVLQAPMLTGISLDVGTLGEDGAAVAQIDVGASQVIQALMAALVVVVLDERLPSTRYSCTASPLMFANGRTTMVGLPLSADRVSLESAGVIAGR